MADNKTEETYEGFDYLYNKLVSYVTSLSAIERKTRFIIGSILVVALSAAASIPLLETEWYSYVQTLIGFPAGIILFVMLIGLQKNTKIGEWEIFSFKEKHSALKRIRIMLVAIALLIILFIFIGGYLPYGVGGTIIVTASLIIYNIMRKTPYELALAKEGIADPRDFQQEIGEK